MTLEAEDFSAFTSPVYARSFLAQYSDFLNVDAQPWLDALEPAAFIPGGVLSTVLDAPEARKEETTVAAAPETRGRRGGGARLADAIGRVGGRSDQGV